MAHIQASVLFILAENDEMENCDKSQQYAAFQRLGSLAPNRGIKVVKEVQIAVGPCMRFRAFVHA